MLPLHDRTRRQLAMLAFVLLCLVPTAVVLAYGITRQLPGHVTKEAARLGSLVRLKVSLARLDHLRPGAVRYEGLELADAETQKTVFRCRRLEASWQTRTGEDGAARPCLSLAAVGAEVDDGGLAHAWRLIQDLLACRTGGEPFDVQISADRLVLSWGEQVGTFAGVAGSLATGAKQAVADVSFRPAGADNAEAARLQLVRAKTPDPITGFILYTGGAPLPCSALALAWPGFDAAGPQSRFQGVLQATGTAKGWEGTLQGQFLAVDLERLVGRRFPHALSGPAQVVLESAGFREGRLEQLVGSVVAGPGQISRSLLDASAEHLGLARSQQIDPSQPSLHYEQLAFGFSLDANGLVVQGQCPPSGSGAMLVDRYGPLLAQSQWQPQPVAALVRMLIPAGAPQVPATLPAEALLRRLPLPAER